MRLKPKTQERPHRYTVFNCPFSKRHTAVGSQRCAKSSLWETIMKPVVGRNSRTVCKTNSRASASKPLSISSNSANFGR